ncbi:MAG: anaerobic ribonucleoside-triphosphate reductase activating protein [Desulfobacteraceae bacterium]|nr:anaerobic ribonucleoside-triphosphate reductase activating protein [Desulfobacteraceae bacterium]
MKIGGLQKHTLIDYPGHLACTVFTVGCNFRCPFCHNPELVLPSLFEKKEGHIKENEFFSFLETRKGLLDGVAITGGEPCLQSDLVTFCYNIKKMGFKVKLDTNGTYPKILGILFKDKLVDYVAMDIKSDLATYSTAAGINIDLQAVQQSISLIMKNAPGYEFRTTCVKSLINENIIKNIGEMIKGAEQYILQPCSRDMNVLNPDFIKEQDGFFSEKELLSLKTIVKKFVKKCDLR